MKWTKIANGGTVIGICRGAWIVVSTRVDDDLTYGADDEPPYFAAYRVVRIVLWRLTVVFEWTL